MVAITNAITGEMDTAKVTMIIKRDIPKYKEAFTMLFQAGNRAMIRHLSPAACKLVLFLNAISDYNNVINMDNKTIAKEMNYSLRQVQRAFNELEALNIVLHQPHPQDNRSKLYFLNPLQSWKGKPKERAKKIAKMDKNQLELFEKPKKELMLPNDSFDKE